MKWHIDFPINPIKPAANYQDKLLLAGSCFAENIGARLQQYKFDVVNNPHGILYNPASIMQSMLACLDGKKYSKDDLFRHHGLWHSWEYHERFSHPDADTCLEMINMSMETAGKQLASADWLILTFGTAGIYRLKKDNRIVGNCHKMPSSDFEFNLMKPEEIISGFDNFMHQLFHINKIVKIIFSVSPVRYVRQGLVESNLSKAVLLYAVHHLVNKFDRLFYFPAYEIVTDELRDYRFYKEDMVHPNETAVQYVWDKFVKYFMSENTKKIMDEIYPVIQAVQHRPLHPDSEEYGQFTQMQLRKINTLEHRYPFLNFNKEKNVFK